jgi:hypothetical protein
LPTVQAHGERDLSSIASMIVNGKVKIHLTGSQAGGEQRVV